MLCGESNFCLGDEQRIGGTSVLRGSSQIIYIKKNTHHALKDNETSQFTQHYNIKYYSMKMAVKSGL